MIIWLTFFISGIIILGILILGSKWKRLKLFFHDENYTYFEICFVIIYFLEQAIFIVLSYFYTEYSVLLTGFFALIVITTVALQRVMLESKSNRLTKLNNKYLEETRKMRWEYEKNMKDMRDYIEILEEENKNLERTKNIKGEK